MHLAYVGKRCNYLLLSRLNTEGKGSHSTWPMLKSVLPVVVMCSQKVDAAGDFNGTSRICSFATQCLHNAIFLCNQALPQPTGRSSSHQAPATTAESSEAFPNPSSTPPNPSGVPHYPSNGHRGRLGTAEGSAAEAAEQLAMLSLDRSRASSGEFTSHTLTLTP